MTPRTLIYTVVILILLAIAYVAPASERVSYFHRVQQHIRDDKTGTFESRSRSKKAYARVLLARLKDNTNDIEHALNHGSRTDAMEDHLVDCGAISFRMWRLTQGEGK